MRETTTTIGKLEYKVEKLRDKAEAVADHVADCKLELIGAKGPYLNDVHTERGEGVPKKKRLREFYTAEICTKSRRRGDPKNLELCRRHISTFPKFHDEAEARNYKDTHVDLSMEMWILHNRSRDDDDWNFSPSVECPTNIIFPTSLYLDTLVQGDQSSSSKPPVDLNTKVAF